MSQPPPNPPPVDPARLARIGLFGGLDEDSLALLASELPVSRVEAGRDVVREGEPATDMFVVLGGEVEVFKRTPDGSEARVAVLGPGDWFGEMAILDVQPRSATVRAVAPSLLLRVTADHVERLLYRRDPRAYAILIMNVARELSRRLRVADHLMAQLLATVQERYVRRSTGPRGSVRSEG